ncbi:MAG: type III secretion protein [Acetobacteraceae bacterium]|nr:type III secretion protein [Acetobacteraceae bacterium]
MTGIPGLSGNLILDHAFGLLLVLARIGATFALMPGLGEATVPMVVKAGMILTLTVLLLPVIEPALPPRPVTELALALLVLTEMANGLWFGWLARVLTASLPMAGQLIADYTGLSNVLLPSPELGAQTSVVARLYEVAVPALILSSGLYMLPLSALVGFYGLIPPGTLAWVPDSTETTVAVVAGSFLLALRLAAPFLLAAVAWNVAIGLIARLVPRLQVFFVALPGQIGLGLLLLAVLAVPLIMAWMEAMRSALAELPGGG